MRRLPLIAALLLTPHLASAQWVQITRNEDVRLFIDQGDIQRDGEIATIAQLVDYTSAQWVGPTVVMSMLNVIEAQCGEKQIRTVAASAYTEQMGRGRVVASERFPDAEWITVPPGGSAEALWKAACGKKK